MPELDQEKRRAGREASLDLRRKRAALKDNLRRGRITFVQAFDSPEAQGMKLLDLLTSIPRVGPVKAAKLMGYAGINTRNTVSKVGHKQREALLDAIGR